MAEQLKKLPSNINCSKFESRKAKNAPIPSRLESPKIRPLPFIQELQWCNQYLKTPLVYGKKAILETLYPKWTLILILWYSNQFSGGKWKLDHEIWFLSCIWSQENWHKNKLRSKGKKCQDYVLLIFDICNCTTSGSSDVDGDVGRNALVSFLWDCRLSGCCSGGSCCGCWVGCWLLPRRWAWTLM